MSDKLAVFEEDSRVNPKYIQAYNAVKSKEIPKEAISDHQGKAGKTFTYVDHIWITEMLQNAFRYLWSFDILNWEVFREEIIVGPASDKKKIPSRTVVALGKLTLWVPVNPETRLEGDPAYIIQSVTEVGVFEPNDAMPTGMAVASAVSRCLCRCVMRLLGVGIQFYKKEDGEPTIPEAWTSLKQFAVNQSVWNAEFELTFLEALKQAGITKEAGNLVDRYQDAYKILATLMGKVQKIEEMPG